MVMVRTTFRESIPLENGKYLSREKWMGLVVVASEPLRRTVPRSGFEGIGVPDPLESILISGEEKEVGKKLFKGDTVEVFPGEYRISKKGNPVFEFKKDGSHRFVAVNWMVTYGTNGELNYPVDPKIVIHKRKERSGSGKTGTTYYVLNTPLTEDLINGVFSEDDFTLEE